MKKMLKKTAALVLSAALCLPFAGCGDKTKTAGKTIELNWWYCGNGVQKDTQLVETTLNEQLKNFPETADIHINLKPSAGNEHKTAVPLALSAGEQIDILNTYKLSFPELVEDGTAIALDEYLKNADELKKIIPDWLWEMCKIDGKTYMIPNYQRATNGAYLVFPKQYADCYSGFDNLRTILAKPDATLDEIASELEKVLLAVRESYGNTKYLQPFAGQYLSGMSIGDFKDTVYDDIVVYYGTDKVVERFITDKTAKAYDYSAQWFKKGYYPSDILTMNQNDLKGKNMLNQNAFIFTNENFIGDEKTVSDAYEKTYGFEVYALPVKNQYYISNNWAAGGHCITSLCKNPEAAVRFLNLLYSEKGKDIYNLIVYGIEGKHYEKLEGNHIRTLEYDTTQAGVSATYGAMKWNMGNAFNAYLNQGCIEGENELSLEVNNSDDTLKSNLMGFYPKTNDIKTELSQLAAVNEEYVNTLICGVLGDGWKAYYDEYVSKMKQAGLDKVLGELQLQVDNFLKNNK